MRSVRRWAALLSLACVCAGPVSAAGTPWQGWKSRIADAARTDAALREEARDLAELLRLAEREQKGRAPNDAIAANNLYYGALATVDAAWRAQAAGAGEASQRTLLEVADELLTWCMARAEGKSSKCSTPNDAWQSRSLIQLRLSLLDADPAPRLQRLHDHMDKGLQQEPWNDWAPPVEEWAAFECGSWLRDLAGHLRVLAQSGGDRASADVGPTLALAQAWARTCRDRGVQAQDLVGPWLDIFGAGIDLVGHAGVAPALAVAAEGVTAAGAAYADSPERALQVLVVAHWTHAPDVEAHAQRLSERLQTDLSFARRPDAVHSVEFVCRYFAEQRDRMGSAATAALELHPDVRQEIAAACP